MRCIRLLIKLIIAGVIVSVATGCASSSGSTSVGKKKFSANPNVNSVEVVSSVKKTDKNEYKKALKMLSDGKSAQAENILKKITKKYPGMAGPLINLGIISMKEGRWSAAEDLFSEANIYSPNNPVIFNYLGMIYRQQGKFSDAKTVYLKAIEQDEKFANAYLNLGILFDLYLSDYKMAKEYYLQYQVLDPTNSNIKNWIIDIDQRIQASN